MNIQLLIETLRFLRPTQVIYRLKRKIHQPMMKHLAAPITHTCCKLYPTITKPQCFVGNNQFTFLNQTSTFRDWNMNDNGLLWTFNLNYMDWLEQQNLTAEEGQKWIDLFIESISQNITGLSPYPTALRIINWAKFFCKHPKFLNQKRGDNMYAQTRLLCRKLEYHLLGNHLLEDAYALFIASIFFNDTALYRKGSRLLLEQLKEQILPDGAHYEQSPMYHCIMLDRLLDCINFSTQNHVFADQQQLTEQLVAVAVRMLGHLQAIVYQDATIPLLNDSAEGIAPSPCELFDYAQRLGLKWNPIELNECGYRKFSNKAAQMEAVVDIGNIRATYQPGHSHADTFSYELRWKGSPYIVDTGISTYEKGARRQYERGTEAHNTVSIDGQDSSHVWGGFRVGNRARVTVEEDRPTRITAHHDGFGHHRLHQRTFSISDSGFSIADKVTGKATSAVSFLHVAPGIEVNTDRLADGIIAIGDLQLTVEGHNEIEIRNDSVAKEYNQLMPTTVIAIHFTTAVKYQILKR